MSSLEYYIWGLASGATIALVSVFVTMVFIPWVAEKISNDDWTGI